MHPAEYDELIPLYAIGALEPAEAEAARRHLETCPICQEALRDYQVVAEELLYQVPALEPPPALRAKLLARLQAQPASPPVDRPQVASRSGWRRFWAGTIVLPRWAALGALLALVALGGLALSERARYAALADALEMGRILSAPDHMSVSLEAAQQAPEARGVVYMQPGSSTALLVVYRLATLPPDKAYQVWLIRDGQRDSGGLFRVRPDGHATVLIRAPRPLQSYQQIGITTEPATGSSGPTGPRVIGGALAQRP
jgi:anti-sigma-K factor RskA